MMNISKQRDLATCRDCGLVKLGATHTPYGDLDTVPVEHGDLIDHEEACQTIQSLKSELAKRDKAIEELQEELGLLKQLYQAKEFAEQSRLAGKE